MWDSEFLCKDTFCLWQFVWGLLVAAHQHILVSVSKLGLYSDVSEPCSQPPLIEHLDMLTTIHIFCMAFQWIEKVWDAFAVQNAATSFSGWKTRRLVHTLLLTIWSHQFESFPVSTSFHTFGADTTFIMLHNVTYCNWVSSGLDESIQQFILNGFQVRIALWCLPYRVSLAAHPGFIYHFLPLINHQDHCKLNMIYVLKIASLCLLLYACYWKQHIHWKIWHELFLHCKLILWKKTKQPSFIY